MNPASDKIRLLRERRSLLQKDAAELLGYEPSFLCAIERGLKDVPKQYFVEKLILAYKLSNIEVKELMEALELSERHYVLPIKSSSKKYSTVHKLFKNINKLDDYRLDLINLILETTN